MSDVPPSVDQFVEELTKEPKWYDLGIFLGVPTHELDNIELTYAPKGTMRCFIELHKYLIKNKEGFSWMDVAEALSRMKNNCLSELIHSKYMFKKGVEDQCIATSKFMNNEVE